MYMCMYFWRRPRSTMWMMVAVVVLLFLCFSPSLSQVGSLVQVSPNEDEPICLGDTLSYNCSVTANLLRWRYTSGDKPVKELTFLLDNGTVLPDGDLGPFKVVLVSNDSINGTDMLTSTATADNGVLEDVSNKSIFCESQLFSTSRTISVTEPEITNASYCMSTIYWSPPPCDANCTVSVDGQKDIGPIPCSVGNLSVEADLSTKTVNITARDQLGQSAVVQAVPATDTRMPCYVASTEMRAVSPSVTSTTMPDASTNTAAIIGVVVSVLVVAVIMVVVVVVLVTLYHICLKRKGAYVDLYESSDHHETKNIQKPEDEQKLVSKEAVSGPPSGKDADKSLDRHEVKTAQKPTDKQTLASQKAVSDPPPGKSAGESLDHHEAKTTQQPKAKDKQKSVSKKAVSGPPSGNDADGKQNRNASSSKSKIEHGDSGPSAMKRVKTSKNLVVDGEIKVFKCATSPIVHCKISPGGDYIATADLDKCVRVLKCDRGDIVIDFKTANAVLSLQWLEYDGEDALMAADCTTMKFF